MPLGKRLLLLMERYWDWVAERALSRADRCRAMAIRWWP